jgi:hypothetical protein
LGPSSGRDTIGKLFDFPLDLASWLVGARAFFSNNDLSFNNDTYALLLQNTGDPYTLARNLWAIDRQKDVEDYKITFTESDPEPSLQSVFFTPQDPGFFKRGTTRMVTVPATGKQLPFTYWLQDQKAPLVLVLPGLGAHRLSAKTLAMAEMVYNHGYSAITISDTLNWEFIERASSVSVPGYTPQDCEDLITTFKLIRDDMVKLYPDRASSTALVGMSLGALKTLFIAAMEAQTDDALFDRYLAINPPVNMFYGVTQLDNFFNAPLKLDPSERDAKIKEILFKTITLGQGELTPSKEVPLSRLESDFLIGLNFRYTLRDLIYTSQSNNNLGVLKCNLGSSKRQPCYNEIQGYSYRNYAEKFVFPYYLDKGNFAKTKEELLNRASLKSIEDQLRENENIRVHINENDFLLRPQDIVWLGSVFGNRLVRFKEGGHLGNLHLPRVQAKIMESLAKQSITETLADSTSYPKSVKDTRENTGKVKTIAPPATLATDEEVVGGEKERNAPLLPEHARSSAKEVIQKFILEWKHEWESKDHENYMQRYSREFTSRDMDWNQWSAYKKDLSERYYQISLTFKDTHITLANTNTQAVVSFKQYYRSDDYSDYGMKSLRLKKENGEWKIFNEQWKPL